MFNDLINELTRKKILESMIKHKKEFIQSIIYEKLGVKATDYTEMKILTTGATSDKFSSTFAIVEQKEKEIEECEKELNHIKEMLDSICNQIKNYNEIEARVFYNRYVLGLTQNQCAAKLGYSLRQIKRINKKLFEK